MQTFFSFMPRKLLRDVLCLGVPLILCLWVPVSVRFGQELEQKEGNSRIGDFAEKEFQEGWRKYSKEKDARPLKEWFKLHGTVHIGQCKFKSLPDSSELQYLYLDCPGKKLQGFFFSGEERLYSPEKIDSFRVKGPVKLGNSVYWELELSAETLKLAGSKHPKEEKPDKESKINDKASTVNFSLQYFLSIAKHPGDRPTPKGKEIFFDSSCPLLYLGKDADFYWDKSLYYSFQASCLPDSPYSWIRIKADLGGNVLVDNHPTEDLQEGARFLAKIKLQSVEKDKIVWSDAELFHE
ncbi:LIC11113 family protein [Leptospira sarikeiensis]|uniref:Uncharacterized protein n=1 Tax=Leptospira sarikeiensis TaxID=2484943 RepID=A0A4R9KE01_9LEPT|nr:hypothetical protein [Leptospira sarikeiensis]TGL64079.1 hypothetical protein EHQ64_03555 [Leptospira sarikeiensis]